MIVIYKTDYNYFGDTVLTIGERSYNVFQYNCRAARELLKIVEEKVKKGDVVLMYGADDGFIEFKPLLPYLRECIEVNDRVAAMMQSPEYKYDNSPGAEIASRYGYY